VNSYNRNFPKRNDGSANTLSFVTSPETVVAYALAGTLDFDPVTDDLDGQRLDPPVGEELPARGFDAGASGFEAPPTDGSAVEVAVDPESDRLQLLEPFPAWDGGDYLELPVLLKAQGKCTTDHISAAGPWLRYRGHLENISGNLFLGAVNAFTGEAGSGRCSIHGEMEPFPEVARHYSEAGIAWVPSATRTTGGQLPGARRHGAPVPGRQGDPGPSFARIHETNAKKQGLLPLTFADPDTYELIGQDDTISVLGLADLAPDQPVRCRITKPDGTTTDFEATHTFSPDQIEWFRAGSALNVIRRDLESAR
jgi:aconitate hydratase